MIDNVGKAQNSPPNVGVLLSLSRLTGRVCEGSLKLKYVFCRMNHVLHETNSSLV